MGDVPKVLYKEARFASEVSREGPAAFYPPRPPFKNLTKVRFFYWGMCPSAIQRGAAIFILFVPTKSMTKIYFSFSRGRKRTKKTSGSAPIKGSNGGYFYNSPLRVQTSKNTFPPYTPFINGQDPLNGKEPFNRFYLQRTGGLNGERQRQRRTKKQHKRKPSLFLCRHPRVFLSGICCYKLAVILNLFQDLPFGVLVVLLPAY